MLGTQKNPNAEEFSTSGLLKRSQADSSHGDLKLMNSYKSILNKIPLLDTKAKFDCFSEPLFQFCQRTRLGMTALQVGNHPDVKTVFILLD
jgi:hypothetical protein